MIIITKDDNTKKKLIEIIQKELDFINSSLNMQKNLSTQVLKYFKELATDIDVNKDTKNMELYFLKSNKVNEMLLKSNENITEYEKIFVHVKRLADTASNYTVAELIEEIDEYNNFYREASNQISINTTEIEAFLKETTPEFQNIVYIEDETTSIEDTVSSVAKELEKEEKERPIGMPERKIDPDLVRHKDLIENTLIISEQDKTVVLPYTFKQIGRASCRERV